MLLPFSFRLSCIWYQPLGNAKIKLRQFEKYVNDHEMNDKIYHLVNRNCQHYVKTVVEHLNMSYAYKHNQTKRAREFWDINLLT